ncbi:MAG: RlmE family RNA methyltransferase [Devosiaceae bacterium]|nr:RlmE family RNA methyltransferase [Devosiaceae bacterium MH13]
MARSSGPRGGLHVKVKTARKRSNASTRWLERQLNDPYVAEAKRQGWRSRAAFKLIEIDDKHRILKPCAAIVDLGVAPGGWAQVAAQRVGSTDADPLVVGIDKLPVDPIVGVHLIEADFTDDDAPQRVLDAVRGRPISVVLSDMAAETTGHRKTDHLRTTYLFELAADFAFNNLAPGGAFLAKVFRGGTEGDALRDLKARFASVHHIKPPASRKESPELYVLAKGYKADGA